MRLTRKGTAVLAESGPGALFALLFETNFKNFNLAYPYDLEWPALQTQVPFTLYRLWSLPVEWRSPGRILGEMVLGIETPPALRLTENLVEIVLERHVLMPLVSFAMLEWRNRDVRYDAEDEWSPRVYRQTPLLTRFLHFELPT